MKKKLYFLVIWGVLLLFLGCEKGQENKMQGGGILEERSFDQLTKEDWEEIHLSKREFNLLLAGLVRQYGEMEVPLESARMFENNVYLTIGNGDGLTSSNKEFATLLEGIVRKFYEHSDYSEEQEPIITIQDQLGTIIK